MSLIRDRKDKRRSRLVFSYPQDDLALHNDERPQR